MSGTSLDGLDLCYVKFEGDNQFEILAAETISYEPKFAQKLKDCYHWNSVDLLAFDVEFGYYLGEKVNEFISKNAIQDLDFVASHGQTIFHQPERNFTLQIGHGAAIKSKLNVPIICDFRTQDVILGGQGAPLVPIGDELLFPQFDACLNLGGFSNISMNRNQTRIAFDICPVNILLNHYAKILGFDFDRNGEIASKANVDLKLLNKLNEFEYYQLNHPKSLGFESIEKIYIPLIDSFEIPTENKIATITQHIVEQISKTFQENQIQNVLITGGGAKNQFLIEQLKRNSKTELIIPEEKLIDFKEALIFAFLGKLRFQNKINCLASVTGAKNNHSSGQIFP